MLMEQTLEKMNQMKLSAMVEALEQQTPLESVHGI